VRRRRDRPLHLLEVGLRWPPETFLSWKLEGLAARGMRVTVASKAIFEPDFRLPGVELRRIPVRGLSRARALGMVVREGLRLLLMSPGRLFRLLDGIRRAPASSRRHCGGAIGHLSMCLPLARLRPDVVHFEWHAAAVDYLPLYDVWGCPIATSTRGSDLNVYPHLPGMDRYATGLTDVLGRVSAVHCVSESLKAEAIRLGLDPGKARVIRPSVDPAAFRPAERNGRDSGPAELRVLTVGWVRWEKGYEYALEAVRRARERGVPVRLEMVGALPEEASRTPAELARVRHTVADLGLEEHVHMAGRASSSDINRRLQNTDVLLHAAVTEGIPNAIVEALACEVPVVATDCGGVSEAITDGVEGILVPPRDPEALADGVLRLWKEPALRARMGKAGRQRVLGELTLEHEHSAFLAMYRDVVGR
jgi:colanic acid/amylovoran biosynthesis glycosyltransferase